jgi:hypothetical protein
MKIRWINKVCSNGQHNAFTGLTFFKGRYLLAFRQATHHGCSERLGPSYGRQILMISTDGEHWAFHRETAFPAPPSVPPGTPIDARDCYFLNLGHELRLHSFALSPFLPAEDRFMIPSYSTLQLTRDGDTWTEPRAIQSGVILWKPIYWRERFWCAGYRRVPEVGCSMVELYESGDGLAWTRRSTVAKGNECALLPRDDDALWAFVRTGEKPSHMQIWESRGSFSEWRQIGVIPKIIQAPHVEMLDGAPHLFGREVPCSGEPAGGPKLSSALRRTKVWRMRGTVAEEVLELPSGGDTSYVGTVVRPDGLLMMSYYSQHEAVDPDPAHDEPNNKPADIFVAGIEI